MEETLKKYFKWVFREDFFTIALDHSGCYLFTKSENDDEVAEQYKQFREAMALEDRQINLCVLGRKSRFNYCSFEKLGNYVFQIIQHKGYQLTDSEIESILKTYCYEFSTERTDLRNKEIVNERLRAVLTKKFVEVDPPVLTVEQVEIICRMKVVSINFLYDLGIGEDDAFEILEVISEHSGKELYVVSAPDSSDKILLRNRKLKVLVVLLCWVLEAVCALVEVVPFNFIVVPYVVGVGYSLALVADTKALHHSLLVLLAFTTFVVPLVVVGNHYWEWIVTQVKGIPDTVTFWDVGSHS